VTPQSGINGTLGLAMLIAFVSIAAAGCDYGRMYDQDSIKTYERKAPQIDQRTVPLTDGINALLSSDPGSLKNPLPQTAETVKHGRLAYTYFCVQCHGPKLDGNGTVGQSFSPLPANLRSSLVLSQDDGSIYAKIRLGYKRHPALFSTVASDDAWSVIAYMRSVRTP
jgi:mono/diheme cytochrome c family protein